MLRQLRRVGEAMWRTEITEGTLGWSRSLLGFSLVGTTAPVPGLVYE